MSVINGGRILAGGAYLVDGGSAGKVLSWPGVPPNGAGALAGIVAVGGLVMNTSSDDDIYENQNTLASPTFVRVDTLPV